MTSTSYHPSQELASYSHSTQGVAQSFHVDMAGMMQLVSKSLYSRGADVVIRELLQNAVDAIGLRADLHAPVAPDETACIEVECQPLERGAFMLIITDNGIGIAPDELRACLGTLAFSSKRDSSNLIGRFGIGFYSTFMLSDEVLVLTRKAGTADCSEWRGCASTGIWGTRLIESSFKNGTCVFIKVDPTKAPGFTPERVRELVHSFGSHLACPIFLRLGRAEEKVNTTPVWQLTDEASWVARASDYGVPPKPLGAFAFDCPELAARGVAYLLGQSSGIGSAATHQLYVRRMLVAEHLPHLAPARFPFLRCVLNADQLEVSAARENLMLAPGALKPLHLALHRAFQQWLAGVHCRQEARLLEILATHRRTLLEAAEDDVPLAAILLDILPVETTLGSKSLAQAARDHGTVHYSETESEYFRMEAKALSEGVCIVRGFYDDASRLIRLATFQPSTPAPTCITPTQFFARFPQPEAQLDARQIALRDISTEEFHAEQATIAFEEGDDPFIPASIELSGDTTLARLFGGGTLESSHSGPKRLILNTAHPTVEKLLNTRDLPLDHTRAWLRLIYTQALLSAKETPEAGENRRHTKALDLLFQATFG